MDVKGNYVNVKGLRLHYLEAGEGDPVLLLHGWPTSSFLWRNIIPLMATHRRVIALDLPGFGKSDKPLDVSYDFVFYNRILDDFLAELKIESVGLVVHDLGGPIGLYWMVHRLGRVNRLALLNTLVYPNVSIAVIAFVAALRIPFVRDMLATDWGLKNAMYLGMADWSKVTDELLRGVREPFRTREAREALLRAGGGLNPADFGKIADGLPLVKIPVRAVYGRKDWILPDVADTMRRLAEDIPGTEVTELPDCGHFLQEDRPEEVGRLLAEFFGGSAD